MKCKLSEKCEFGNLCKDATRHDSLTVLGCSSFKTKKPMTEQEYIQTCNTEKLAELLMKIFVTRTFCHLCHEGDVCDIGYECKYHGGNTKDFVEWLKQPHSPK